MFDLARATGSPISAGDAAEAVVEAIRHPDEDVDWTDRPRAECETVALTLHTRYCGQIAPRYQFSAIEQTLEPLEIVDLGITLRGTLDRVRVHTDGTGRRGIADLKTGRSAATKDGKAHADQHALQLGVYELLAEITLGEPIEAPAEVIGLSTTKPFSTGTASISGARALLLGTETQPGALQIAADMLRTGQFHGNPRSMLCTGRYCPIFTTCRWRGL